MSHVCLSLQMLIAMLINSQLQMKASLWLYMLVPMLINSQLLILFGPKLLN